MKRLLWVAAGVLLFVVLVKAGMSQKPSAPSSDEPAGASFEIAVQDYDTGRTDMLFVHVRITNTGDETDDAGCTVTAYDKAGNIAGYNLAEAKGLAPGESKRKLIAITIENEGAKRVERVTGGPCA